MINYEYRLIMKDDANVIAQGAILKGPELELSLTEQTLTQAFQSAKEQLTRSLLH
jgi:ribose 5-phosphate isomerase RpiB